MAALIGALRATLSADTAQFEAGMRRAQRSASTAESGIKRSLGGIGNTVKAGLAGLASGLTVGLFTQVVKGALDYAGGLGEVSQQLGVTTRDLQSFRYIAGQAGVGQEELDKALGKLTVTLGQVAAGAKGPTKAFNAIGISVDDLKGKDTGEVMRLIADGLSKVQDRSQRAAIEVALFGRAGAKLDTVLSGGSNEINRLADAAERLGVVLSEEQIAKADETADKLEALQTVLKAKISGAVADNADSILELVNSLVSLVGALGRAGRAWGDYTNRVALNVVQLKKLNPFADQAALANQEAALRQRAGLGSATATASLGPVKPFRSAPPAGTGPGIGQFLASDRDGAGRTEAPKFTSRKQAIGVAIRELEALGFRVDGNGQSRGGRTGGHANNAEHNLFAADVNVGRGVTEANDPVQRAKFDALARDYQKRGFQVIWNGEVYEPGASGPGGKAAGHRDHLDIKAPASIVGKPIGGGGADTQTELYQAGKDAELEVQRARVDRLRSSQEVIQEQFRSESDILNAQRDLATDYVERNNLSLRMLEVSRNSEKADLAYQVELYKLTDGAEGLSATQAAQRDAQQQIVHELEIQRVHQEEESQRVEEAARLSEVDFDLRREALEGEAALAETASEQRDVQLRILELAYQQEKARLTALAADKTIGWAAQEEARRRLAALDGQYRQQQQGVIQGTRGPMESYLNDLPTTAAKWNEALESVTVNGLQSLEDGLVGIITGTESVGEAFKKMANQIIADLIRIMIQKMIMQTIGAAIGGGAGGIPGMGPITGFATGGFVRGPGTGTSDSIPAKLSNGEFVVNAKATKQFLPLLQKINLGKSMGFATGGLVRSLPIARQVSVQRVEVSNDNPPAAAGGGGFVFNNYAKMSPAEARQTGMQAAAAYRQQMARSAKAGF